MRDTPLWIMLFIVLCLAVVSPHAEVCMAQETAEQEKMRELQEQAYEISGEITSGIHEAINGNYAPIEHVTALYDQLSVLLAHPDMSDTRRKLQNWAFSELTACISDSSAEPEGRQLCGKTASAIFEKRLAATGDMFDRRDIAEMGKELVMAMADDCTDTRKAIGVYRSMAVLNTRPDAAFEPGMSSEDRCEHDIRENRADAAGSIFACFREKGDETSMLSVYKSLADIGNGVTYNRRSDMVLSLVEYYCALGRFDDAERIALDLQSPVPEVYKNSFMDMDAVIASTIAEARTKAGVPRRQPKPMGQKALEEQALYLGWQAETQAKAGDAEGAFNTLKSIGEMEQNDQIRYMYGSAAAKLVYVFGKAGKILPMHEAYACLEPLCRDENLQELCADAGLVRVAETAKTGDMQGARNAYDELAAFLHTMPDAEEGLEYLAYAAVTLICNYAEKKDPAGAHEIFQAFLKNPGGMESLEEGFNNLGKETEKRRIYDAFAVLGDDVQGRVLRHMIGVQCLDDLLGFPEKSPSAAEKFLSELAGLGNEKEIRIRQAKAALHFIDVCCSDSEDTALEAAERVFISMRSLGKEDEIRLQQSKAAALLCDEFAGKQNLIKASNYYRQIKDDRTASDDELKEMKEQAQHTLEEAFLLEVLQ